ncbi:MAG TPA: hypothetical protein DCY06_08490 [Bacteroidetes bacterium]|nr:hypothetical protein [Bacteroidota bacterium]
MDTKAKINLKEGLIELEGSEEFVSKYIDIFRSQINITSQDGKKEKDSSNKKERNEKEKEPSKGKRKGPKKIIVEEFKVEADKTKKIPSFKEFLSDKKITDKSSSKFILAVGYYITKIRGEQEFSEGNIEFAYKILDSTKRPTHLHQTIINQKNSKSWFEDGSVSDKWELSRVGEIYIEKSFKSEDNNN